MAFSVYCDEMVDASSGIARSLEQRKTVILNIIGLHLAKIPAWDTILTKKKRISRSALSTINKNYVDNRYVRIVLYDVPTQGI